LIAIVFASCRRDLRTLEGAMVFIDDLHHFAHSLLADHQRIGNALAG